MGLFRRKEKKDETINSNESASQDYYVAKVSFYQKDNFVVGRLCLTEGVLTLLPLTLPPTIGDRKIENYGLSLLNITKGMQMTVLEYFKVIDILKKYAKSISETHILVELNSQEIDNVINEFNGR